ncbi:beta-galactosidase [Christiangramia fulva]|uniref:Beta-galactosidase n=1 Tax=Christiangramia fulva TaxID=2126553 RepID=A0A2R3Z5P1_9FLAO|nr:sugar-binding domain-containing protein [Christiangramia fulva]AVR45591.1 beta-galactosidase [Christiangramia fulva]
MQSKFKILIFLAVFIQFSSPTKAQESGKKLFNKGWSFQKGDSTEVFSNNSDWKNVDLPHDWSIEGPFASKWASGTGFLPGGIGWYKKDFNIENYDPEENYSIYFDGVYKNSEVWINGRYLGKRPNGFIPFQYDLTPYLKPTNNEILVKVDHSEYADSRFYTGSGIYRNVYLLKQNPAHFAQWGVFFTTPEVSNNSAKAKISVEVKNNRKEIVPSTIQAELMNKEGKVIASTEKPLYLRPGKQNYIELNLSIENPELWSPKNPNLYNLKVTIIKENQSVAETWNEKVGFRDFKFDPDKGFFLNGENILIKGVCLHHDAGALGAAVPKEVWRERFQKLKDLGANAIRMSHYPHQDYIYDLADEMGFLVQDEAFDEWEFGKNKWITGWNAGTPGNDGSHEDFAQWGAKDVQDMVRRNRNHASIIMWSIGNEIDYPNDPYSHPVLDEGLNPQIYGKGYQPQNPPAAQLGKFANELVKAAKMFDTTRAVTAALAGVTMSNHTIYPEVLDIVGYNYQEFRYDDDHKNYPKRVIYGSENGDALEAWLAVKNNDYISSQFLWTAFDFIGEAREWPNRSSGAGILDLAGKPKPDFYFRKSLWNENPMVFIGVTNSQKNLNRRWNIQPVWKGKEGEIKWISVYTNTDEVELFLNGESLGRKKGEYTPDQMIGWEVPYQTGELKAKAFNNGKEVASYSLNTPGEVNKMQVSSSKEDYSDSGETFMVDILLVDRKGSRVIDEDKKISFEIEGPAKILALESGDRDSHEIYQSNNRKTYQGRLRAYVQTTGNSENIKIQIKANDLKTQKITIKKE